jgi:hypothetical protein
MIYLRYDYRVNPILSYLNGLKATVYFTIEREIAQIFLFLEILVDRSKNCINTSVQKKTRNGAIFAPNVQSFFKYQARKAKQNNSSLR